MKQNETKQNRKWPPPKNLDKSPTFTKIRFHIKSWSLGFSGKSEYRPTAGLHSREARTGRNYPDRRVHSSLLQSPLLPIIPDTKSKDQLLGVIILELPVSLIPTSLPLLRRPQRTGVVTPGHVSDSPGELVNTETAALTPPPPQGHTLTVEKG